MSVPTARLKVALVLVAASLLSGCLGGAPAGLAAAEAQTLRLHPHASGLRVERAMVLDGCEYIEITAEDNVFEHFLVDTRSTPPLVVARSLDGTAYFDIDNQTRDLQARCDRGRAAR